MRKIADWLDLATAANTAAPASDNDTPLTHLDVSNGSGVTVEIMSNSCDDGGSVIRLYDCAVRVSSSIPTGSGKGGGGVSGGSALYYYENNRLGQGIDVDGHCSLVYRLTSNSNVPYAYSSADGYVVSSDTYTGSCNSRRSSRSIDNSNRKCANGDIIITRENRQEAFLWDSHCHIQMKEMLIIKDIIQQRAYHNSVRNLIVCGVSPGEDWANLAMLHKGCLASLEVDKRISRSVCIGTGSTEKSHINVQIYPQFGLHPWWIRRCFQHEGSGRCNNKSSTQFADIHIDKSNTKAAGGGNFVNYHIISSPAALSPSAAAVVTDAAGINVVGKPLDDCNSSNNENKPNDVSDLSHGPYHDNSIFDPTSLRRKLLRLEHDLCTAINDANSCIEMTFSKILKGKRSVDDLILSRGSSIIMSSFDNAMFHNSVSVPVSGVGECGLDKCCVSEVPMHIQIGVLMTHMRVAYMLQVPISLHIVQTWSIFHSLLDSNPLFLKYFLSIPAIVFHSCNHMPYDVLCNLLQFENCFFSLNGKIIDDIENCNYKYNNSSSSNSSGSSSSSSSSKSIPKALSRAINAVKVLRSIPLSRLLIESDSPDQLPNSVYKHIHDRSNGLCCASTTVPIAISTDDTLSSSISTDAAVAAVVAEPPSSSPSSPSSSYAEVLILNNVINAEGKDDSNHYTNTKNSAETASKRKDKTIFNTETTSQTKYLNEPSLVYVTYSTVAKTLGISLEDLTRQLHSNNIKIFWKVISKR